MVVYSNESQGVEVAYEVAGDMVEIYHLTGGVLPGPDAIPAARLRCPYANQETIVTAIVSAYADGAADGIRQGVEVLRGTL